MEDFISGFKRAVNRGQRLDDVQATHQPPLHKLDCAVCLADDRSPRERRRDAARARMARRVREMARAARK